WDVTRDQVLLFDPRAGATWTYADGTGWQRRSTGISPPVWSVDPAVRRVRDLAPPLSDASSGSIAAAALAESVAAATPRAVFDTVRGVVVMTYAGATWEWNGSSWAQSAAPPSFGACAAALALAYDPTRWRTVAVGCTVPGGTWEWDGATWTG